MIAFHGGEGKIVKDFFSFCCKPQGLTNRKNLSATELEPSMQLINKLIIPTDEEIKMNPRARSAKLRIAQRLDAPSVAKFFPRAHENPF